MNITRVVLAVDSRQVSDAKREMDGLQKSGEKTEKTVGDLGKTIRNLAAAVGVGLSVREIVSYTDRWSDLNARLVNVTGSKEAANEAMEKISQTARRTYSSLEQTANIFTRNAVVLDELGFSTDKQLELMTALNTALVISGTKGQEAETVLTALSRAFANGELRGQNFNTVIQSGGRIVQALADGLNVGTLELRAMAEAGELKTEPVIRALISQVQKLNVEMERMPSTIGDGFVQINNALFRFVGLSDEGVGASETIANGLLSIADNFELVAKVAGSVTLVMTASYIPSLAAATASMYSKITAVATATTVTNVFGQTVVVATAKQNLMTAATIKLNAALALFGGPAGVTLMAIAGLGLLISNMETGADRTARLRKELEQLNAAETKAAIDRLEREAESARFTIARMESTSRGYAAQTAAIQTQKDRLEEVETTLEMYRKKLLQVDDALGTTTGSTESLTNETIALNNATKPLISNTEFLDSLYQQIGINVYNTADAYYELMGIQEEVGIRKSRLIKGTFELSEVSELAAEALEELNKKTQKQKELSPELARVVRDMRNDISSAFADMMMNGSNAFDAIAKSFERMIYKMVADWAASGIMNMIGNIAGISGLGGTSTLGAIFSSIGGGGGAAAAAGSAATGGSILGTVGGAIKGGASTLLSGASTVGSAVMGGAKALGGAVLKGGAALLSNPIGWAALGAGAIAAIFGKHETRHKNAGFLVWNDPAYESASKFSIAPFASGLQPVGYTRAMDHNMGLEIVEIFRSLDEYISEPARARGHGADLQKLTSAGFDSNGHGSGNFFGAANHKGAEGAPLEDMLDRYARGLVASYAYLMEPEQWAALQKMNTADMVESWRAMMPGFAMGLDYVPKDNFAANLHHGEAVITAKGNTALGQMAAALVEMKAAMVAIASHTAQTARQLQRWDFDGLPEERAFA